MKNHRRKKATRRYDEDLVFVPIDLPIELEAKLQILAAKAGLTLNDYLSKVTSEQLRRCESWSLHPVKSLTFGPVEEQGQLAQAICCRSRFSSTILARTKLLRRG